MVSNFQVFMDRHRPIALIKKECSCPFLVVENSDNVEKYSKGNGGEVKSKIGEDPKNI